MGRLTVRRIVVAGLLGAITILLGATRLGFVPVPTPIGDATIMHLPVIIGGILGGSIVGAILGLFFGMFSFIQATIPVFKDPLVVFVPRILIGVTAALSYQMLRRWNEVGAVVAAAIVGAIAVTIGKPTSPKVGAYIQNKQAGIAPACFCLRFASQN